VIDPGEQKVLLLEKAFAGNIDIDSH